MNLKLGLIIKDLRTKRKITQEELATFLGVTPQAISRWESGVGYPDIETLPMIADFFSVTTDDILGVNRDEKELRRVEIYKKILERCELGNDKEALPEARAFAAEFPSDERIQENLANIICRGYMWEEEPDTNILDEAENIYHVLIETTKDSEYRNELLEKLAALYAVGYKDKFKVEQTVKNLPTMMFCRESVGAAVFKMLDGSVGRTQGYIEKLTDALVVTLREYIISDIPNNGEMWDTKIEMFYKLIDLYRFVFGEKLLFYHSRVAALYRIIATYKVAQKRYDETLDCLEKMVYHITERGNTKVGDKFDSPFVTELDYPDTRDVFFGKFADISVHNEAYYVLNGKMSQSRYDPLREMPRFKQIIAELQSLAK